MTLFGIVYSSLEPGSWYDEVYCFKTRQILWHHDCGDDVDDDKEDDEYYDDDDDDKDGINNDVNKEFKHWYIKHMARYIDR